MAIYVTVNFALYFALTGGATASKSDGRYYVHSHGKWIRDIDEREYRRWPAYEVRWFSGVWMLGSLITAAFFFYVYPAIHVRGQE